MSRYLHYKAGPAILSLIRHEGLDPRRIAVFAAPAGGPKWFVSVGFDKALMSSGLLGRGGGRVLLAGSSAGAWRCLAMACASPPEAYENLRLAYSRNVFTEHDTPATIAEALERNVEAFLKEDDLPQVLRHPVFDLAVHTVRSRGPSASPNRRVEGGALLASFVLNVFTRRAMDLFFERVVFYAGSEAPLFTTKSFRGKAVRLTTDNIRLAARATGSLPYIIAGVDNIADAPPGVYRDGGLVDYQLNQDYHPGDRGVTLFFHYQERIVPGWFDKALFWRNPPGGSLDRVLQVYPGRNFVDLLPGAKLPDRQDFITFVNDPAERIRRWDEAAQISEILGQEFLETVESGKLRELVEPL